MLHAGWAGTGVVLMALLAPFPAAAATHHQRPRGFEGTVTIVHTGTAVGSPADGFTASGSLRYRGRYKLAGNRVKEPQNATVTPASGGWFDLGGSGTNSLDM